MHKWSFRTIVNQTIRSHIYNERSKQATRIQTVSLDAEIPGTDGLTYGDMITSENIRYMDEKEKYAMEVKFDVKIPEAAKMRASLSVEIEALLEFLSSTHRTCAFHTRMSKRRHLRLVPCGTGKRIITGMILMSIDWVKPST